MNTVSTPTLSVNTSLIGSCEHQGNHYTAYVFPSVHDGFFFVGCLTSTAGQKDSPCCHEFLGKPIRHDFVDHALAALRIPAGLNWTEGESDRRWARDEFAGGAE